MKVLSKKYFCDCVSMLPDLYKYQTKIWTIISGGFGGDMRFISSLYPCFSVCFFSEMQVTFNPPTAVYAIWHN